MRFNQFGGRIVLALAMTFGVAQVQAADGTAAQPAAVSTAAKSGTYSTKRSTMATLLADPAAKAVLEKYIPDLLKSDHIEQMSGMTLKDVQQAVGQYAPDLLSEKKLAAIDADLAKLPAKK